MCLKFFIVVIVINCLSGTFLHGGSHLYPVDSFEVWLSHDRSESMHGWKFWKSNNLKLIQYYRHNVNSYINHALEVIYNYISLF